MLQTISRFMSTVLATITEEPVVLDASAQTEAVRAAMLDALSPLGQAQHAGLIRAWSCIVRAPDIQTLWYLRSDLLSILAEFCGEPAARKQVEVLTQMFCGLIPAHQMGDRRLKAIQKRQAAAFAQVD